MDDLVEHLKILSLKSEHVKASIYSSVIKDYVDLHPTSASQWDFKTIKNLQAEIAKLGNDFEKNAKPKMQTAALEHKDLIKQYGETKNIISMLELLLTFHREISLCKGCPQNKFGEMANHLKYAKTTLDILLPSKSNCEIKIFKVLQKELVNVKTGFMNAVEAKWRSLIVWKTQTSASWNSADGHLKTCLKINPLPEDVTMTDLIGGMEILNLLSEKVNAFAQKILTYFIKPLAKFKVLVPTREKVGDVNILTITKVSGNHKLERSAHHTLVYEKITQVIDFIHILFDDVYSSELQIDVDPMKLIGDFIWKDMSELLINNLSGDVVPANTQIGKYEPIYKETVKFECELIQMGFISPGTNKLSKYVSDINIHFNTKFCCDILSCAHDIMLGDMHNLIQVDQSVNRASIAWDGVENMEFTKKAKSIFLGSETIDEQLLSDMFSFPVCHVSDSVQKLVDYIYKNLISAVESPHQIAVQIYHSCRDIFELYINVVPMYHKEALKLPQFAAVYFNNCMYLSHHCATLGHQFRNNLPNELRGPSFSFVDYVSSLRKSGREHFIAQLQLQQRELITIVETCDNFVDCVSRAGVDIIEKAINQIIHHLSHLLAVWDSVLPKNICKISIALLFNTVLENILSSVFRKEFLSAEEAAHLHTMLGIFVERGRDIFHDSKDNGDTSVYDHIRSWKKFQCMIKMMDATLLKIVQLWDNGEGEIANCMNEGEVRSLIRTLFQNTDQRSEVLSKIR